MDAALQARSAPPPHGFPAPLPGRLPGQVVFAGEEAVQVGGS
ncbi:hypothetical protein ABT352_22985 [Streptosporangium sp. NPDC000563]